MPLREQLQKLPGDLARFGLNLLKYALGLAVVIPVFLAIAYLALEVLCYIFTGGTYHAKDFLALLSESYGKYGQ